MALSVWNSFGTATSGIPPVEVLVLVTATGRWVLASL